MTWLHADAHPHNGGYLIGTGIFLALFVVAVVAQILTRTFSPWIGRHPGSGVAAQVQ
jgi:hypothetical protein